MLLLSRKKKFCKQKINFNSSHMIVIINTSNQYVTKFICYNYFIIANMWLALRAFLSNNADHKILPKSPNNEILSREPCHWVAYEFVILVRLTPEYIEHFSAVKFILYIIIELSISDETLLCSPVYLRVCIIKRIHTDFCKRMAVLHAIQAEKTLITGRMG